MTTRLLVVSLAAGICGFCVAWTLWHLWVDHQLLHALVNMATQQVQKGK